jgi:hypothetical protein
VPLLAEQRSLFRGAIGQHQLGKRESDQTRAKQHKTGNGHGEETFRSEFFTHGTPPIVCALLEQDDCPVALSKDSLPRRPISTRDDVLMQHPFEPER